MLLPFILLGGYSWFRTTIKYDKKIDLLFSKHSNNGEIIKINNCYYKFITNRITFYISIIIERYTNKFEANVTRKFIKIKTDYENLCDSDDDYFDFDNYISDILDKNDRLDIFFSDVSIEFTFRYKHINNNDATLCINIVKDIITRFNIAPVASEEDDDE